MSIINPTFSADYIAATEALIAEDNAAAPVTAAPVAAPVAAPAAAAAVTPSAVEREIDAILAERASAYAGVTTALKGAKADLTSQPHQQGNVTYNTATNVATIENHTPELLPGQQPNRLHDGDRSIPHVVEQCQNRIDAAFAKLEAHTFDARTGQKVPTLTGEARRIAEVQYQQAVESGLFEVEQLQALNDQRVNDALAKEASNMEELARAAYTNGDPTKLKLLNEAIAREEADALAKAIIRARRA